MWTRTLFFAGLVLAATPVVASAQMQDCPRGQADNPSAGRAQRCMRDRDHWVDLAVTLTPDQARQRDQLRDELTKQANLDAAQQQALSQPLDHYVAQGGDPTQLRDAVRSALDSDCRGACLGEAIRSLNRARHRGMEGSAAVKMVGDTLRAMKQERERAHLPPRDAALRDQLHLRIGAQLQQQHPAMHKQHPPARAGERPPNGPGGGTGHGHGPHHHGGN